MDGDTTQVVPMKQKRDSFFVELIKFALIAVVIVLPIRLFIAQPFIVSGASMDPIFHDGEYLIVDELSYRFTEPERGDVIIFRYPENPSKFFIKRIIGLPGETVSIEQGNITINNPDHPQGFTLDETYLEVETKGLEFTTLSSTEYFVLGDNRPASSDSRIWGPLEEDLIIGQAFLRLFPITRTGLLPGNQTLVNEASKR